MDTLVLLVAVLAVYRVTLLVTSDELTRPWRERTTELVLGHRLKRRVDGNPVLPIDADIAKARCRCGYEQLIDPSDADDRDSTVSLVAAHVEDQNHMEAESGSIRAKLSYLLQCSWCASMWIAPLAVASALAWGDGWGWWLAAGTLAASAVTGFLASYASP